MTKTPGEIDYGRTTLRVPAHRRAVGRGSGGEPPRNGGAGSLPLACI